MSLINQMLQDLEKRRASSAERGALPHQVRVLPRGKNRHAWWWWWALGVGITALVTSVLVEWQQRGSQPTGGASTAPAATLRAPAPVAPPASAPDAKPANDAGAIEPRTLAPPASRLTLDLEHAPAAESRAQSAGATEYSAARPVSRGHKEPRAPAAQAKSMEPMPAAASARATGVPPAVAKAIRPVVTAEAPNTPANATVTVMQATTMVPAGPQTAALPPPPAAPAGVKLIAPFTAPAPAAGAKTAAAEGNAQSPPVNQIDKRSQQLSPQQLAENDYRSAVTLLNQGRLADAQEAFRLVLKQSPAHIGARQGLFGVLLDARKNAEAEQVLQDGLRIHANHPGFAMALARLQVDRGDTAAAVETLQKTAPAAQNSPDYLAFLAALLQRQARHQAAVDHYEAALRLAPQSGVWLMGLGISLQAINRNLEAHDVFRRAKATNTLNPELQAFIDQRLKQLQ